MKILHYINNLGSGGAEKLLSDILPLMKERGHEVHLAISNNKRSVKKFSQIIIDSKVQIWDLKKSFYNPLQIIQLILLLRNEKYDIVHAHLFPTQYWLSIAAFFKPSKTKFVKTEHSVYNERKNYKILRVIEKIIYSKYDKIICITEAVRDNLQKWLDCDFNFLKVILNGVNLKQFDKIKGEIIRSNNLFDDKDNNILMVGRFDGIAKDQRTVINALVQLPESYKLFFAGEGPDMKNMIEYTNGLGLTDRVNFLGLRSDVYMLMAKADINVLSSKFEGLSGVTLEALASGKPFIGSNVVGINNIVPNPDYLFEQGDYLQLSKKIESVINDKVLSNKMIDVASSFILDFDIQIMVEKYLHLYNELIQ